MNLVEIKMPDGVFIRVGTKHDVRLINGDVIEVKVCEIREEHKSEHYIFVEHEGSTLLWKRVEDNRIYTYDLNEFIE